MVKKIYLETFGCQMNVLDSELVEGQLRALGYDFTPHADAADIVLYNTCSVRQHSEDKVLSRLGRMKIRKQSQPDLIVGVIGCMAERDGKTLLKRMPQVDLLCGPGELDKLPALLDNVFKTHKQQSALAGNNSRRSSTLGATDSDGLELLDLSRSFSPEQSKYQAYVRVVRGCNKFCTYCVVPYTRGPEVSRSPAAIIDEVRRLSDAGALEVTLLGQTVNHYVYDHGTSAGAAGTVQKRTTFAELLYQIHESVPELPRLRFLTSFPADFGDEILQVMDQCRRICRYLHIPAQSGSNRILKMMNRGYTVESYLALLERARNIVPGIILGGDIIVGFPTETEEDYQATRRLVAQAQYKNCYIFKYSPRPGTVAVRRYPDDVPEDQKRRRNNDVLQLQNEISEQLNRQLLGSAVDVLCEGPSGWNKPAESFIAGTKQSPQMHDGEARVELGNRLSMAMNQNKSSKFEVAEFNQASGHPGSPVVQLTGRTTADQIVVFDGSPALEGRIVSVRVHAAHAMTIFGRLAESKPAPSELLETVS
jgi:tRNA-2-methylthio-N6-dimethylallyladenosine synthase